MAPALEGGIVLPYGVVHPGYCKEGSKVGCVGGAHDERKKPPTAHHNAHGHGVGWGFATCGQQAKWIGPDLPLSLPSPQKCSGHGEPPLVMGWGAKKQLPAYYEGLWQFWELSLWPPILEREGGPQNRKNQDWPFTGVTFVKMPRIKFWISKSSN